MVEVPGEQEEMNKDKTGGGIHDCLIETGRLMIQRGKKAHEGRQVR